MVILCYLVNKKVQNQGLNKTICKYPTFFFKIDLLVVGRWQLIEKQVECVLLKQNIFNYHAKVYSKKQLTKKIGRAT